MASIWVDQNLTVNGCTVYDYEKKPVNGEEEVQAGAGAVMRDQTFTLPGVTPKTTTASLHGDMTVPIIGQYEDMEAILHYVGVASELAGLLKPGRHNLTVYWADQWIDEQADQALHGGVAYLTCTPKVLMPQIALNMGEAISFDIPYTVTAYKLFLQDEDGNQGDDPIIEVDRLSGIFKVGTEDIGSKLTSLLGG